MHTEPVPYGLTSLTPVRLLLFSIASGAAGLLLARYQRDVSRRF
jgi:hypothetical protein